ncbi:hypothetical protein P153DRAFT_370574 [Dothidotthia symphoricarpi CBS 119687]|uniref:Uncharacterized protein n=1 Tax=Dothidotthia symphoricarpi CBS 119687 TaxID=1392245 RepID=A0A6A6A109_9PLEO|nr:uncharacterized protein P153DRAFT_370574 [Dothidotthia symphoricarpi CBS 119687]KAF2124647.1 hypothetical protein P153DRAFT_370574 [Dothidotthia symphoricarpi CBS 119687]
MTGRHVRKLGAHFTLCSPSSHLDPTISASCTVPQHSSRALDNQRRCNDNFHAIVAEKRSLWLFGRMTEIYIHISAPTSRCIYSG